MVTTISQISTRSIGPRGSGGSRSRHFLIIHAYPIASPVRQMLRQPRSKRRLTIIHQRLNNLPYFLGIRMRAVCDASQECAVLTEKRIGFVRDHGPCSRFVRDSVKGFGLHSRPKLLIEKEQNISRFTADGAPLLVFRELGRLVPF